MSKSNVNDQDVLAEENEDEIFWGRTLAWFLFCFCSVFLLMLSGGGTIIAVILLVAAVLFALGMVL